MSSGSIVPKQARTAGISLGELYDLVIADTMAYNGIRKEIL
jgi:D-alanine-D-alanine ligase